MFGSAILEVGIGLVIIYLLMSLMVTQFNNVISWTLKLKARLLYTYIKDSLLKGDLPGFLDHPLLNMRGEDGEVRRDATWIEPDVFANAMANASVEKVTRALNMFTDSENRQAVQQISSELLLELENPTQTLENLQNLKQTTQNIRDFRQKDAVIAELNEMIATLKKYQQTEGADARIALLEREVQNLNNYSLRTSLSLLLESISDFNDAIQRLARWFDEQIAETSQMYTRYINIISFVVGLILAIIINVDTLHIANTLYQDADLRQSVVEFTEGNLTEIEALIERSQAQIEAPTVTEEPAVGDDDTLQELDIEELEGTITDIQVVLNLLTESQVPIWWGEDNRFISLGRVIGWFITAVATTMGAPFWFDLLKRWTGKSVPHTPPPAAAAS